MTATGIAVPITIFPQGKRRTQVKPVGGTPRIPVPIFRFTPHKKEGFSTHPHSREAALHGVTVAWIETLETLHQTNLLQVGRALGSARLR